MENYKIDVEMCSSPNWIDKKVKVYIYDEKDNKICWSELQHNGVRLSTKLDLPSSYILDEDDFENITGISINELHVELVVAKLKCKLLEVCAQIDIDNKVHTCYITDYVEL